MRYAIRVEERLQAGAPEQGASTGSRVIYCQVQQ